MTQTRHSGRIDKRRNKEYLVFQKETKRLHKTQQHLLVLVANNKICKDRGTLPVLASVIFTSAYSDDQRKL